MGVEPTKTVLRPSLVLKTSRTTGHASLPPANIPLGILKKSLAHRCSKGMFGHALGHSGHGRGCRFRLVVLVPFPDKNTKGSNNSHRCLSSLPNIRWPCVARVLATDAWPALVMTSYIPGHLIHACIYWCIFYIKIKFWTWPNADVRVIYPSAKSICDSENLRNFFR